MEGEYVLTLQEVEVSGCPNSTSTGVKGGEGKWDIGIVLLSLTRVTS